MSPQITFFFVRTGENICRFAEMGSVVYSESQVGLRICIFLHQELLFCC